MLSVLNPRTCCRKRGQRIATPSSPAKAIINTPTPRLKLENVNTRRSIRAESSRCRDSWRQTNPMRPITQATEETMRIAGPPASPPIWFRA